MKPGSTTDSKLDFFETQDKLLSDLECRETHILLSDKDGEQQFFKGPNQSLVEHLHKSTGE